MNKNNYLVTWLGVVISISTFSPDAWPGEGTLKSPCSRTIYLAKFSPGTVVIPESGAIEVPIGVMPFVSWDSASAQCGQPTSAALELTLTCTPAAGGAQVTIGPVSFGVPTPTTPSAQEVGSPLTFTIPEGVITNTTPQMCVARGTYTVTFGTGFGEGAISGTGDVPIVLMEPTILEISRSRLEVFRFPFDGSGYGAARRGDQMTNFFVVVNNDPTESVELDFTVTTNQTARLPDGFTEENAVENLVYSIAWPRPGTGNFPLAFKDELDPFERIPLPDPTESNVPQIDRTLSIAAKAATMVPVDLRSFGVSDDGASSEILAKIAGSFSDGRPAYGAASTILNVNSVPPKLTLREYRDEIKVNADNFANFGRVDFANEDSTIFLGSTHQQGNTMQEGFGAPFRVTELHGESQQDPNAPPFPSSSTDYFRTALEEVPITLRWKALFAHIAFGYVAIRNQVTITGWDGRGSLLIPMIVWLASGNISDVLDILYNAQTGNVTLSSGGTVVFNGLLSVLLGNPTPSGFFIDLDIFRLITLPLLVKKEITSNPAFLVSLVTRIVGGGSTMALSLTGDPPETDTIQVFYEDGLPPAFGTVTVSGHGVTVDSTFDDGFIEVFFYTDTLPPVPATTLSYINITVPDAINNPLTVPVVIRVDTSSTATSVGETPSTIPETTQLRQNYPNPFNPSTTIRFDLRGASEVTVHIYNLRGQLVRTLIDGRFNAGNHSVVWDGRDDLGGQVTSGLYVTRMRAGEFVQHHKMLLIK